MHLSHTPPLSPACVSCLMTKALERYPADAPREVVLDYQRRLGTLLQSLPDCTSGPELQERINALHADVFGDASAEEIPHYAAIKSYFNTLMQDFAAAEHLADRIHASPTPLRAALGYAMIGNYIDFGALGSVDERKLRMLLQDADERIPADSVAYAELTERLQTARRLVYLTDNCGEVVMDRLCIEYLRKAYPAVEITVMVRGKPVLNDATREDAVEIGLDRIPGVRLLDNGDGLAGTALGRISEEAAAALADADIILAKGQGNFETLQGSGLPICYVFLCKCAHFAARFSVPLYTGVLCWEGERDE